VQTLTFSRSLILCAAAVVAAACTTTETIKICEHGVNPVSKQCNPPGNSEQATAGDTTGDDETGPKDCPNGLDPQTLECQEAIPKDVVAAEDPGTQGTGTQVGEDVKQDGVCDFTDQQNLKIGMPCTSHGQCETCYCYDEEYLAPFRFCTLDCSSGPGSECPYGPGDNPEYACLRFTQDLIKSYDLTVDAICMPRCSNAQECKIYAPNYNSCPTSDTKWEGWTIQAAKTCQVK